MKTIYKITFYSIFIAAFIFLLSKTYVVNGKEKRTLVDKIYSSDRYGKLYITYIWKLPNGKTRVDSDNMAEYSQNYEVKKTYIFKTQTFHFKK